MNEHFEFEFNCKKSDLNRLGIDPKSVKCMPNPANSEKILIFGDRMSKDYELLKKEKTELENEVENLKSQIREMEKHWHEESGKVEAYEFALSVIFGHANP